MGIRRGPHSPARLRRPAASDIRRGGRTHGPSRDPRAALTGRPRLGSGGEAACPRGVDEQCAGPVQALNTDSGPACVWGTPRLAQARIRRERDQAALRFAKDRDLGRLEATMARLDAGVAAAVVRPSRIPTAAEARAYLESLPELWAKTSDAGRHAIAEAVFERIDVLGASDSTFTLTAAARARRLGRGLWAGRRPRGRSMWSGHDPQPEPCLRGGGPEHERRSFWSGREGLPRDE